MYRQLVDTPEGYKALVGRLVRLELGTMSPAAVRDSLTGIVTEFNGKHVYYTDRDGTSRLLRVIEGAYAVYVTTPDALVPENEEPMGPVRWNARHHVP